MRLVSISLAAVSSFLKLKQQCWLTGAAAIKSGVFGQPARGMELPLHIGPGPR